MNELMIKYTMIGDFKHSVFVVLHNGGLSQAVNDKLSDLYYLLEKEEHAVYDKVLSGIEGV